MNENFYTRSGRNIKYYGMELGDSIISKDGKSLNEIFKLLIKCYDKDTAFPTCQKDYEKNNDPTYGHCAVTAMIIYDMFGGTIHKIRINGGTHYFNKINDIYIDLTRDQFDLYNIPLEYEPNEVIDREYCGKNIDTKKRYDLLLSRLKELI